MQLPRWLLVVLSFIPAVVKVIIDAATPATPETPKRRATDVKVPPVSNG